MSTQMTPLHITNQLHEADIRGGLSKRTPHCIAYKLPKESVTSVLANISKKAQHDTSIYTVSADWIQSLTSSIASELSRNFNAPPENFIEHSRNVANIISSVGNGIWSSGITPINAIRDIETNIPLYISDYFDQLSGWSREHIFDKSKPRIGSNISGLQNSRNPYTADNSIGPESALSERFVKIGWNLPVVNVNSPFNISSNTAAFGSTGDPSSGEVYRYFAFIDSYKQAISIDESGSIKKKLYDFTDPSQLWRIENYGSFYALYNKKYGAYLGRKLHANTEKPNNNWHESAVYVVEDNDTRTYSIGYTHNNQKIDYPDLLKNLTLVTIPLVAWRNSSGQFLNPDAQNGSLSFSNGEQYNDTTIPKPEQLFLFVPHPDFSKKAVIIGHNGKFLEFNPSTLNKVSSCSYDLKSPTRLPFALFDFDQNIYPRGANYLASRLQQPLIAQAAPPPGKGTRTRVWKSDPSVKSIGIRELFLVRTDIQTGPKDDLFETVSTAASIAPDTNGDFLLDFDNNQPSQVPESDNHTRFDVVHTYSIVRYAYDLVLGDWEYLDGAPPKFTTPWGNKRLQIHPHAGEDANAYYSREEGVLKFFYTNDGDRPIYLCRSLDVVAHETGHSLLDIMQPGWMSDGQTGAFHEAFGDLNSLFVLISMAEIADLFITLTKANLRDPNNFLSAVGEEFGDALFHNKGKGLRNLSNTLKGSQAGTEVHALSLVFSGFYYDVLVDVFALERNPSIKSDTETLLDVATNLRRALITAIRVSSSTPTDTKFQELATNLETAFGTLGRRLGVDLTSWKQIVRKHAKERELSIAGNNAK
ncbi:hypothetical protein C1645_741017 [Glomus cerebriforme]|uniref:Uncharacterized protein n=1 Tax=Glomus cerebriforme TaxID=658196 RepID=A0A397SKN5_9GLOM|nr:hypothetical protein C1645_741017 [Glomus cerebriforme]